MDPKQLSSPPSAYRAKEDKYGSKDEAISRDLDTAERIENCWRINEEINRFSAIVFVIGLFSILVLWSCVLDEVLAQIRQIHAFDGMEREVLPALASFALALLALVLLAFTFWL